jgi:hypothetical protein
VTGNQRRAPYWCLRSALSRHAATFVTFLVCLAAASGQIPRSRDIQETPLPALIEMDRVRIPMRDGIGLIADLYLPPGSGRWPTILIRTPYSRRSVTTREYRFFVEHGYAVVAQDVRGRYDSGGFFGSVKQEGPDGNDTINWISRQSWSNGRVGMAGASYVGMTQWWAAVQNNPHLVTIFPIVSGDDEYMDRFYSVGGAVQLSQLCQSPAVEDCGCCRDHIEAGHVANAYGSPFVRPVLGAIKHSQPIDEREDPGLLDGRLVRCLRAKRSSRFFSSRQAGQSRGNLDRAVAA